MKIKHHIIIAIFALSALLRADSLLTGSTQSKDERIAQELLSAPSKMKRSILEQLEFCTAQLWNQPNPQAVIDAMGSNAAELFTINEEFTQFLQTFLTEKNDTAGLSRLQAIQAKIRPYTKNEDGTVTINNQSNLGKSRIQLFGDSELNPAMRIQFSLLPTNSSTTAN